VGVVEGLGGGFWQGRNRGVLKISGIRRFWWLSIYCKKIKPLESGFNE